MARVELAGAAVDDLERLIFTHSLSAATNHACSAPCYRSRAPLLGAALRADDGRISASSSVRGGGCLSSTSTTKRSIESRSPRSKTPDPVEPLLRSNELDLGDRSSAGRGRDLSRTGEFDRRS